MKKFDYLRPKTIDEALSLLNQYGKRAKLIAGGTDVIVMIKQKTMSPDILISLRGIPGLDQIQYDGTLRIGPMVTHRAIEKSELIRKEFSALADAVDLPTGNIKGASPWTFPFLASLPSSLWIKIRFPVLICFAPLPPFRRSFIPWNRMN